MKNNEHLPAKKITEIINDKPSRLFLARRSHAHYFQIYFNHYIKHPFSEMHYEMFRLTEDTSIKKKVVCAFRGSGKSSIITTSYPLWAIMGIQELKFIVIVSKTQEQARSHIKSIKQEIENNQILRKDLGPFKETQDEWNNSCLVLPDYGAKILSLSMEQSCRGIRHNSYRPQLIIADDIEDLQSTRTQEARDKAFQHLFSELVPAGDEKTTLFVVGNLLHDDSIISRLKKEIKERNIIGLYREYPILNKAGNPTWAGKFKSKQEVLKFKKEIPSETVWNVEYMLKVNTNQERIISKKWINYYDEIPKASKTLKHIRTVVSVDPAYTKSDTADYTAIVCAELFMDTESSKRVAYILPTIINQRFDSQELLSTIIEVTNSLTTEKNQPTVYIEDVGFQKSIAEQLKNKRKVVKLYKPNESKQDRLASVSNFFFNNQIYFPKQGAEKLINQIVNFGNERYDDLADATVMILKLMPDENYFDETYHKKVTEMFKDIFFTSQIDGHRFFDENEPFDYNARY